MILESVLGVVTGLIGNIVTTVSNNKAQKVKNQHELKMRELEINAMKVEADLNLRVTETQLAGEIQRLEEQSYNDNIKLANAREVDNATIGQLLNDKPTSWLGAIVLFLLGLVDVLKGFMRPGLTLYLTIITSWLTFKAYSIVQLKQDVITPDMAVRIFTTNMDTVTYLTISVITWWFADRRVAKFALRLNDGNFRK
jgi:hypothetical protein